MSGLIASILVAASLLGDFVPEEGVRSVEVAAGWPGMSARILSGAGNASAVGFGIEAVISPSTTNDCIGRTRWAGGAFATARRTHGGGAVRLLLGASPGIRVDLGRGPDVQALEACAVYAGVLPGPIAPPLPPRVYAIVPLQIALAYSRGAGQVLLRAEGVFGGAPRGPSYTAAELGPSFGFMAANFMAVWVDLGLSFGKWEDSQVLFVGRAQLRMAFH